MRVVTSIEHSINYMGVWLTWAHKHTHMQTHLLELLLMVPLLHTGVFHEDIHEIIHEFSWIIPFTLTLKIKARKPSTLHLDIRLKIANHIAVPQDCILVSDHC